MAYYFWFLFVFIFYTAFILAIYSVNYFFKLLKIQSIIIKSPAKFWYRTTVIFIFLASCYWFPLGPTIILVIWYLLRREYKFNKLITSLNDLSNELDKRSKWLEKLKKRLKVNPKPDLLERYNGWPLGIYKLGLDNNIAVSISDLDGELVDFGLDRIEKKISFLKKEIIPFKNREDVKKMIGALEEDINEIKNKSPVANNFYFSINEAKKTIDRIISTTGEINEYMIKKEEFYARKEAETRRKENTFLLANAYKQRLTSNFKQNLSTVDKLTELTPIEFEKWVKKNIFETNGWNVEETRKTGDGGIDLVLKKDDEYSIVQCKRFKKTVGEPALRDFYGTMVSEGVSRGYFVTTGLFSLSALKFAEDKPIELIDRRILAQKYL
ncbi:MAG: restriction endonuclease [Candidatus Shapirobacteria bacterium]|nr:restriction endonuclease [Candidatus Shapirobacteria bacterium]MDD3002824.1 restriction endonuclease [Candidatus Shapirobacteria bacterium]MDD4382766.1 restriction endonuclease [Candidatus Shapirobacteria bacterium]